MSESKRDEILRIVLETGDDAENLMRKAQTLVEQAQTARDIAEVGKAFYGALPTSSHLFAEDYDYVTTSWRAEQVSLRRATEAIDSIPLSTASSTAIAVGTAMLNIGVFDDPRTAKLPGLRLVSENLNAIMARRPLLNEVIGLLRQFGLDVRQGAIKSPIEMLEEAAAAINKPPHEDAAIGALLGAREAVQATIERLLKRRPQQEKTGSWQAKILSLGQQCGLVSLVAGTFDRMSEDASQVINALSEAKDKHLSRTEQTLAFNSALQFLKNLLLGVDPTRLR